MTTGTLSIISTPIGNLEDITVRAIKTLFSVDYLLCEDTRTTGILLTECIKRYKMLIPDDFKKPELVAYYDEIEQQKTPELINLLLQGKNLGIVSENGTPLISDPGFVIVREAIKKGIAIVSLPGPNAAVTALTLSGLPVHSFYFGGYFPKEKGKRVKTIKYLLNCKDLKHSPTFIFYESPHRIKQTLEDIKTSLGNITIVLCRELTKTHEQIIRGTVEEVSKSLQITKGEMVILLSLTH